MTDNIISWAIILFIVVFLYCINKKNKVVKPTVEKKMDMNLQDEFLAKIDDCVTKATSEVQIAVEKHKESFNEKYSQDLEMKKKLSKFARDKKLDSALIAVWNEIKNYPIWAKREDFQKFNKIDISSCTGSEEKNDRNIVKSICFSWKGKNYQIVNVESKSYVPDPDVYAEFILLENEEEVFGINTSLEYDTVSSYYRCFDIIVFKKKGEWYKFLLDAWRIIEIEKEKMRVGFNYYNADKIKDNFQE